MKRRYVVKELAEKKGLTQMQLYHLVLNQGVEVSLGPIQRIWQNHRNVGDPRSSTLIALAKVLGVRIEDLYVEEEGTESYTEEHTLMPGLVAA